MMRPAATTPSIAGMTMQDFKALPHVITGESKEVRYFGEGLAVIRFIPTIYSFTHNRCAEVPGSHIPRLRASRILVDVLRRENIRHAYREVTDEFVLADLVMPHEVEFAKYATKPFVPPDLSQEEIARLPKAPPIEIIAKRYLTGTTKHGCIGMAGSSVRDNHPFYAGMQLEGDGALPEMIIRFDWRNPLTQPGRGERQYQQIVSGLDAVDVDPQLRTNIVAYLDRVADKVLPLQVADLYIDVWQAQRTAFMTAVSLENFLALREMVFYDLCMFIDASGTMVYGEISPDCGRYRSLDGISYDKDVWRSGGSSADVIKKWERFCELLEDKGDYDEILLGNH